MIEFVVDTNGLADTTTLRSQNPADSIFAYAVNAVIRDWRFSPALKDGKHVRQLMVQAMPFDPGPMPSPVAIDTTGCGLDTRRTAAAPDRAWLASGIYPVVPLPENPQPQNPRGLGNRARGEVLTQFVVDERGEIVWCTFKVLRATGKEIEEAVRQAMATWRYEPATLFGQRVPQVVEQGFRFPRI